MNNILNTIKFVAASMLLSAFLAGCGGNKKETVSVDSLAKDSTPSMIVSIGRIEPELKIVKLSSEVSGIVKKVYFQAGDSVKKGDVIIELSNDLERAQLTVNSSQANTKNYDIKSAEVNRDAAQIRLDNSKTKYERLKSSFEKGAETKQNLDNANTDYLTAQKEVERLTDVVMTYKKQQQEIYSQEALNNVQLQRRFIRAPADGLILMMDITPGSSVQALTSLADFAPKCPMSVVCEVDELFADQIALGDKAYVRYAGQTEKLAEGTIIFAAPYLKKKSLFADVSNDMEDRRVREVRVRLINGEKLLYGSRVECVILKKK
ncbi:MAG TPA: efflux RND transporter periplasmic adaptor subunit [Cytophagaceae bacterium]|nr:efflux RND transporter periplasmic adaptor subunit [Cytophagaceae bacterium]